MSTILELLSYIQYNWESIRFRVTSVKQDIEEINLRLNEINKLIVIYSRDEKPDDGKMSEIVLKFEDFLKSPLIKTQD